MYFSPLIFCKQTQTLIHALAILKIRHILSKVYKFMCLMATRFSSLFHPFYYFFLYKVKIDRKKIMTSNSAHNNLLLCQLTHTEDKYFFLSIYQLIFVNFFLTLSALLDNNQPKHQLYVNLLNSCGLKENETKFY